MQAYTKAAFCAENNFEEKVLTKTNHTKLCRIYVENDVEQWHILWFIRSPFIKQKQNHFCFCARNNWKNGKIAQQKPFKMLWVKML